MAKSISELTTSLVASDVDDSDDVYLGVDDLQSAAESKKLTLTELRKAITGVIDVRDYDAMGDGVTDDTTAIQAAFDAAVSSGAVVRFVGGATYLCDSWLAYSHDLGSLRIEGNNATLTHSGSQVFIQIEDGFVNLEMEKLNLDGFDFGVRTKQEAWVSGFTDLIIRDCLFEDCRAGTYFDDDGATNAAAVPTANRVIFEDNEVTNSALWGLGLFIEQVNTILITENTIDGATRTGGNLYGIYARTRMDDGSNFNEQDSMDVSHNVVRNINNTDATDTYNSIGIAAQCYGARVIGNRVEHVDHASSSDCEGIYVKAANGVVALNTLYNAGTSQGAIALKGNSFELTGDGSHKGYGMRCFGNTIRCDDAATVARNGIYVGGGDKCAIALNFIEGVREGIQLDSTYGNESNITGNQLVRLEIPSSTGAGIILRGADNVIISENLISQPDSGSGTFYGIWTTSGTHSNVKIKDNIFHDAANDDSSTRGIQLATGDIAGLTVEGNVFESFGRAIVTSSGITVTEYEIWKDNVATDCSSVPVLDMQHTSASVGTTAGNFTDGVAWAWCPLPVNAFAGIYCKNASTAQTVVAATPEQATGFTNDFDDIGATSDSANDKVTIDRAGNYRIDFQVSFTGTASSTVEWFIRAGAVLLETAIGCQVALDASGSVASGSCSGVLALPASSDIEVWVESSSTSVTPVHMQLTAYRMES